MLAAAKLKTVAVKDITSQRELEEEEQIEAGGTDEEDADATLEAGRTDRGSSSKRRTGAAGAAGAGPACSGQAYFIGDGQPYNPQAFLDDILDGLGAVRCGGARGGAGRDNVRWLRQPSEFPPSTKLFPKCGLCMLGTLS